MGLGGWCVALVDLDKKLKVKRHIMSCWVPNVQSCLGDFRALSYGTIRYRYRGTVGTSTVASMCNVGQYMYVS